RVVLSGVGTPCEPLSPLDDRPLLPITGHAYGPGGTDDLCCLTAIRELERHVAEVIPRHGGLSSEPRLSRSDRSRSLSTTRNRACVPSEDQLETGKLRFAHEPRPAELHLER